MTWDICIVRLSVEDRVQKSRSTINSYSSRSSRSFAVFTIFVVLIVFVFVVGVVADDSRPREERERDEPAHEERVEHDRQPALQRDGVQHAEREHERVARRGRARCGAMQGGHCAEGDVSVVRGWGRKGRRTYGGGTRGGAGAGTATPCWRSVCRERSRS